MADITLTEVLDFTDSEEHELGNEAREFLTLSDTVLHRASMTMTMTPDAVTIADDVVGTGYKVALAPDTLTIADSATPFHAIVPTDAMTIADTVVNSVASTIEVVDGVTAADDALPVYAVVVGETITIVDLMTPSRSFVVTDAATLADLVTALRASTVAASEVLTIADAVHAPATATIADAITIADEATALRANVAAVVEALTVADTVAQASSLAAVVVDAMTIADGASLGTIATVALEDIVEVSDAVRLPTATVPALFVNLQTGAAALWSGLPVNSLVEVDGVLYGASQDGLHVLGADDDDGDPIEAEILYDLDDMGVRQRKRLKSVYVVAQSAGPFTVRVINDQGTFDYLTKLPRTVHATNHRAVPGRGLDASHYRIGLLFTEPGAVDHVIVEAEATVRSL